MATHGDPPTPHSMYNQMMPYPDPPARDDSQWRQYHNVQWYPPSHLRSRASDRISDMHRRFAETMRLSRQPDEAVHRLLRECESLIVENERLREERSYGQSPISELAQQQMEMQRRLLMSYAIPKELLEQKVSLELPAEEPKPDGRIIDLES